VRNRMRSGTRGESMPGKARNRQRSSLEGAARRDADYFRRGHTAGRAPIRRPWAIPRAVYEVEIKGRLRVRIHRGVLFDYSPIFSTFAAAGSLVPVCFALCRYGTLS
jgi:hypothetical protein